MRPPSCRGTGSLAVLWIIHIMPNQTTIADIPTTDDLYVRLLHGMHSEDKSMTFSLRIDARMCGLLVRMIFDER